MNQEAFIKKSLLKDIPEIKINGRTSSDLEPLALFWTASGFECNISGSELWVELEVTYDIYEPWFSYTINGNWVGRQMLQKGRYEIPLFRGMSADQVKNVRFFKDIQAMNEDGNSLIRIHSLGYDGQFFPIKDTKYKIEFIGDSITSGEGLFGAKEETDWIPMFFSAIKNYTYQVAQMLDADYRIISQSGWGVYCGWDNNIEHAIPKYYKQICGLMRDDESVKSGSTQLYDFGKWQPDYVVVNLGTNDASAFEQPQWIDDKNNKKYKLRKKSDGSYNSDDIGLIQEAIKEFIGLIRECNPKAKIVWCYGMLGAALNDSISDAVSKYVSETKDNNVSYLKLPDTTDETVGSRQHPGYKSHKSAAKVLAEYLSNITVQN